MSHLSRISTLLKNEEAIRRACAVLGLEQPTRGTFQIYQATVKGLGFKLKDWRFPVVVNTDTGELKYDNYNGGWGNPVQLDQFNHRYALEVNKMAAENAGLAYEEFKLDDGASLIRIHLGGENEMAGAASPANVASF